jgi:hypothetical protein
MALTFLQESGLWHSDSSIIPPVYRWTTIIQYLGQRRPCSYQVVRPMALQTHISPAYGALLQVLYNPPCLQIDYYYTIFGPRASMLTTE